MKESCFQFGSGGRLVGVLTEPSEPAPKQGLILINAGLVPKFGPYRLYAQLARRLARDGVATLRFDLGGVGDSLQEASSRPLSTRTDAEVRAAVDQLCERHALKDVVLAGLCSGAEDAFRAAARDERITRVVLMDPFAYRTRGWARRHLAHRVGRRALRALGVYEPIVAPQTAGGPTRAVSYKYMEHAEAEDILRTLLARRALAHFVYTAGMREHFNHESQLQAQFPELDFGPLVTVDYLAHLDHTQLLQADRDTLIETIARRLGSARLSASS
jgi:alpha-beta hydrolase superfamily lysophospholipase